MGRLLSCSPDSLAVPLVATQNVGCGSTETAATRLADTGRSPTVVAIRRQTGRASRTEWRRLPKTRSTQPMALVVLLRGVNVGGHRRFRPSVLAQDLRQLDVANIGAAGTFIVRKPVGRRELRAEVESRLPFEADVVICDGTDILRLAARDPFSGHVPKPDVVPFVSVMVRRRRRATPVAVALPDEDSWSVKVLSSYGQFVLGLHKREMKAIAYLAQLERVVGTPLTTRGWSTILAIGRTLGA